MAFLTISSRFSSSIVLNFLSCALFMFTLRANRPKMAPLERQASFAPERMTLLKRAQNGRSERWIRQGIFSRAGRRVPEQRSSRSENGPSRERGSHQRGRCWGGSHWGGGILISSVDQARIGRMLLAGGQGPHGRVLSAQWVARMLQPCPLAPFYGYLLWLNRNRVIYPNASEDSYFALGAGSSITWMSPRQDAVVVTRWIESEHTDGFFQRIESALSTIR